MNSHKTASSRREQPGSTWGRLAFLCWAHMVISWGFFIMQSWIPTYLHHKGLQDLSLIGSLSALPWGVSSTAGLTCSHMLPAMLA